jgi:hypothetical protein
MTVLRMAGFAWWRHYVCMEREPITPMTDEEAELFRFLRFGQLPDRVPPGQMVETVQAEGRPEEPPTNNDPRHYQGG